MNKYRYIPTTREKILWRKVRFICESTMYVNAANTTELFAIIHKASQADFIHPFNEKDMCDLILYCYKHNLYNSVEDGDRYLPEELSEFIIASLDFRDVYHSKTTSTNLYNLIRQLIKLYEESLKKIK